MTRWIISLLLLAAPAALAQSANTQAPARLDPAASAPLKGAPLETSPQSARQSVKLSAGQSGRLGQARVTVLSVQDSRCPEGMTCIWAGEVKAQVLLRENGHWQLLRLNWRPGQPAMAAEQVAGQPQGAPMRITAVSGQGEDLRLTLNR